MNRTLQAFGSIFLVALLLAGCARPPVSGPGGSTGVSTSGTYKSSDSFDPTANVNAQTFKNEQELRTFLKNAGGGSSGGYRAGGVMMEAATDGAMLKTTAAPVAAPMAQGSDSNAHSTTNNQVASVDEGDIIKTDGNYIYTITGSTLFIVKAYPGEDASVVKTIDFKGNPTGLFIEGNKLAVFGNFYDIDYFKKVGYVPRNGMTFLTIYDVSDKANPTITKEYKFEGNYLESRMKDGQMYLVVVSSPTVKEPLPVILEGDVKRTMAATDIAFYPIPYDSVQYATVHSVSLKDANAVSSKAVAVQWDNKVYMSDKNIYLTTTQNINEWEIRQDITMSLLESQLTADDSALIQKIKNTDDDVLSQAEKRAKIFEVYSAYAQFMDSKEQQAFQDKLDTKVKEELDKYEALTYTVVTRIALNDGSVSVEATGKVPGNVLNQFSMDENNDVFRVATTIQPRWWWPRPVLLDGAPSAKVAPEPRNTQPTNNVYLLDKNLELLGKINDIATGETIQSARFIGDRLYLVTFKQVDPFFVFDLSDPKNPKELGHLKVPGFSRYLHPYDATHIIGIGRDATDMGRQQGLKISLFDVTDVENPKEVAKWVANDDYSQSTAEWEHKAFLFDKDKQLLVIPAYSYNWNTWGGQAKQNYNGAMVFKITSSDISLRGIVDHSQNTNQYYGAMVERSLWINDLLYTKSPSLLRINKIDDLSSVKKIALESKATGPYPVY